MMVMSNRQPQGDVGEHVGEVEGGEMGEAEVLNMRRVHRKSPKTRMCMHMTKNLQQRKTRNAHLGPSPATNRSSTKMMIGQPGVPMVLGARGGETTNGIGKDGLGIAMLIGTSRLAWNL